MEVLEQDLSTESRPRVRVLYLQHANCLSGAVMSLLYTANALAGTTWEPIIALIRPGEEVANLYRQAGIQTIEWTGIGTVEHTTSRYLRPGSPLDWVDGIRTFAGLRRSVRRTHDLIDYVQPDIVHLNSVVLFPSAMALRKRREPWVWHVRERPVRGLVGARSRAIGRALEQWPDETLFISQADREAWVENRCGIVVRNFVDLQRFHPSASDGSIRSQLGIGEQTKLILFLGSISRLKGVLPLLDALAELRGLVPDVRCVLAGAVYRQSTSASARAARCILPLLGTGTWSQQVEQRITSRGLADVCIRIPFAADVVPLIAAADVVVFPAMLPHFPRPAMEAAAMATPVVASDLPGIAEVVINGRTGLLTPVGDAHALSAALARILSDEPLARRLGTAARKHAEENFDLTRQVARITATYERLLQ